MTISAPTALYEEQLRGDLVRLREAKDTDAPGTVPATPGAGLQGEKAEHTV